MPGLSIVLVAEAPGDLAGAIEARPPSWIFAEAASNGVPLPQALLGTVAVIKISPWPSRNRPAAALSAPS